MKLFLAVFMLLLSHHTLKADLILRWSPASTISTISPIMVDLFLDETGTSYISNFGVSGASYLVTRSGVGSLGLTVENPSFDDGVAPTSDGTFVSVVQTSILGVTSNNSLKIGSFTINPTTPGAGSLTISKLNPGFPGDFSVYTNNAFDQLVLDQTILPAAPFNYQFTAVPEPGSIATPLLLAAIVSFRRTRLRR